MTGTGEATLGLREAYMQSIGLREADNREAIGALNRTDPQYAALLLGRGCMQAIGGEPERAHRLFDRAREAVAPLAADSERQAGSGGMAVHLYNLATYLSGPDDEAALYTYQQGTYEQAMRDLYHHSRVMRGDPTQRRHIDDDVRLLHKMVGTSKQNVMLALLTRRPHPGLLVTAALPHLDNSKYHSLNYDMLVVHNGGGLADEPTAQAVQIKNNCLGYCGDPVGAEDGKRVRAEYAKTITLVSGHCDVRLDGDYYATGEKKVGIGSILKREHCLANKDPDHVRALDITSDGLLLAITTAGPERHGLVKPDKRNPVFTPSVVPYRPAMNPASVAAMIRRVRDVA